MDWSAEQVAALVSTATVSLLHSLLPSHWLCFALVGRAQGWKLRRTLLVTAVAGLAHVLSTVALGVLAAHLGREIVPEESFELVSALLLIVMGALFLVLHLLRKGHHHDHDVARVAVAALILMPTLSPCTAVIPMFLAVAKGGFLLLALTAALLAASTLAVMLTLVALSWLGAERIRFEFLNRYEKAIIGGILCLLGVLVLAFHHA